MIVVSDTSPLNYLILVESVDILPKLYSEVVIPTAVLRELEHPGAPEAVHAWLQIHPSWLRVEEAGDVDARLKRLDAGEAEAITLARKLGVTHILIDERRGTEFAKEAGLTPQSLLTVLDQAAEAGFLNVRETLRRLQTQTNYRMTPDLAEWMLTRSDARDQRRKGQ